MNGYNLFENIGKVSEKRKVEREALQGFGFYIYFYFFERELSIKAKLEVRREGIFFFFGLYPTHLSINLRASQGNKKQTERGAVALRPLEETRRIHSTH